MGKAVLAILLAAGIEGSLLVAQQTQPGPAGAPEDPREADRKAKVEKLTLYFLEQYGKALAGVDWVNRSMAVISLAGIDDARVTEKLMEVLSTDASKYVRVFAWESLHARNPQLTQEQRGKWIDEGLALASKVDVFNGRLRVGLLRAVASRGPTGPAQALFRKFFAETNLLYPPDGELLEAMAQALAAWKDRQLVRDLVVAMNNGEACYRAEFVLRALKPPLKEFDEIQQATTNDLRKEWAKHQKDYAAWVGSEEFANLQADGPKGYAGRSAFIPEPEAIVDPASEKWRRQLEVPSLHLDQLAVNIVLDSTGSMGPAIEWVKSDVSRLMRALRIIAREPTMGITLYRDRGDAYVVHVLPMTGDGAALGKALKGVQAHGGGDYPEAVYDALYDALCKQRWPKSPTAHKVVILVADAPPHQRDLPGLRKLLERAPDQGFRVHCLKVPCPGYDLAVAAALAEGKDEPLHPGRAMDNIAGWGKGNSYDVRFVRQTAAEMRPGQSAWIGLVEGGDDTPYRQIITSVLRSILTKEYHDRVDPFVKVLLETMEESPAERRVYLPALKPQPEPRGGGGGGGGGRPPGETKKPVYKQ
jgi:hypothetical protein